jgi:hypothetical protein
MKWILALVLVAALCSGIGALNIRVALGMDAFGDTVGNLDHFLFGNETQVAPTFSAQFSNKMKDVSYGLGVDYQYPKVYQEMPEGWSSDLEYHSFIPVYGILAYNIPTTNKVSHDIIAQFGYSYPIFNFEPHDSDERYSVKGGLFYGLGAGVNYQNVSLNVLYRVNNAKVMEEEFENNAWEENGDYGFVTHQWNISVGYRFGQ